MQNIYEQWVNSGITSCLTVLTGVIVLVIGQWAIKFFIEPIQEMYRLLKQIAKSLVFYANIYGVETDDDIKIAKVLRGQASDLQATVWTIPWYRLWQFFGILPKKDDALKASANLIGLSNAVLNQNKDQLHHAFVRKLEKEIEDLLNFK